MTLKVFLIPVLALLIPAECGYNNDDIGGDIPDPPEHILGKWQEIARGNEMFPELPSDGHVIEFLPDGTMPGGIYHSAAMRGSRTESYRVDAEFLYINGGKPDDGYTYRYTFTGTDTLRLDCVDGIVTYSPGTPAFNTYERLKTNKQ
jgi:hypothetical protein